MWWCVLTSPGTTTWPRASTTSSALCGRSAAGPTASIRPPRTRTEARRNSRRASSKVATQSASRSSSVEEDAFIAHERTRAPRDNARFRARPSHEACQAPSLRDPRGPRRPRRRPVDRRGHRADPSLDDVRARCRRRLSARLHLRAQPQSEPQRPRSGARRARRRCRVCGLRLGPGGRDGDLPGLAAGRPTWSRRRTSITARPTC